MNTDPDRKPSVTAHAVRVALRSLSRLGFLGSMVLYGAVAGTVALVLWGLRGQPVIDWKFVIAFSVAGPLVVGVIDYVICQNDRPGGH